MKIKSACFSLILTLIICSNCVAQDDLGTDGDIVLLNKSNSIKEVKSEISTTKAGWFSLGGRSTLSAFDRDGWGLGTGGQFRVQLTNKINTDWFADYISINVDDKVRSEYYHIGWSVLFYPFDKMQFPKLIQPYILAGHCFDYNRKTEIANAANSKDRWGSAVQGGLGIHFNLSERFDVSLTSQYMIHFTKELEVWMDGSNVIIANAKPSLEGHLLSTISLNYKIARLWKK